MATVLTNIQISNPGLYWPSCLKKKLIRGFSEDKRDSIKSERIFFCVFGVTDGELISPLSLTKQKRFGLVGTERICEQLNQCD